MILFRYCKRDGGEFISHLDTMRHIQKTLTRAKITVEYSKGFHPHMLINMSSPIPCGVMSQSEYCVVATNESAPSFAEKFNAFSPRGIKCMGAWECSEKPNIAALPVVAEYSISGIAPFTPESVLDLKSFEVFDKRSQLYRESRDKIISISCDNACFTARLSFGNGGLRPDALAEKLKEMFGGEHYGITKLRVFTAEGVEPENKI